MFGIYKKPLEKNRSVLLHATNICVNVSSHLRQAANISCAIVGNIFVDPLDVVLEAPTSNYISIIFMLDLTLALMDWAKTTTSRRDSKHLSFGIWCALY